MNFARVQPYNSSTTRYLAFFSVRPTILSVRLTPARNSRQKAAVAQLSLVLLNSIHKKEAPGLPGFEMQEVPDGAGLAVLKIPKMPMLGHPGAFLRSIDC